MSTLGTCVVDGRGALLGFDDGIDRITGWRNVFPLQRPVLQWPQTKIGGKPMELEVQTADGDLLKILATCERLPRGGRWQLHIHEVLGTTPRTDVKSESLDAITGWPNEQSFREQIQHSIECARFDNEPRVLLIADVDRMRRINDKFGRPVGDHMLAQLATLAEQILEPDAYGRLAGDTIAMLIERSGRREARRAAARLRQAIEQHPFTDLEGKKAFGLTLSIGAASWPADAENVDELLRRAHEARIEAHRMGGNRVWSYVRRHRVPLEVPIYFDGQDAALAGFSRDLSHSGMFVQTAEPMGDGMRCALNFEIPGVSHRVHILGRVVRAIHSDHTAEEIRVPGMGVEFERFGGASDRRAMERYLHAHAAKSWRSQTRQTI